MRYSSVSAAFMALAAPVLAQTEGYNPFTKPVAGQIVPAGSSLEITWQAGLFQSLSSSITLLQGKDQDHLDLGQVVVASVKNSDLKYTWKVPEDVPKFATYGFQFTLLDDQSTPAVDESLDANKKKIIQYSFPFNISTSGQGGSGTTTIKIAPGTNYTPLPTSASHSAAHNTTKTPSASASATVKPSSNFTITSSTLRPTGAASPTTTPPATQSTNAAVSNVVSGGVALVGGFFLAFVL